MELTREPNEHIGVASNPKYRPSVLFKVSHLLYGTDVEYLRVGWNGRDAVGDDLIGGDAGGIGGIDLN